MVYWRMTMNGDSAFKKLLMWMEFRVNICDDLRHALHSKNIILDPTEEQVFDHGLYLIDCLLGNENRSLRDWPAMPFPQENWAQVVGNRLIAEQRSYDNDEQTELLRIGCQFKEQDYQDH
jgi:hypothetical protein